MNTDQPVIFADGTQSWYDNIGKLHRESGPAMISAAGTRYWYRHGRQHRVDGPAVIDTFGKRQWWLDGARLTEAAFKTASRELNAFQTRHDLEVLLRAFRGTLAPVIAPEKASFAKKPKRHAP